MGAVGVEEVGEVWEQRQESTPSVSVYRYGLRVGDRSLREACALPRWNNGRELITPETGGWDEQGQEAYEHED